MNDDRNLVAAFRVAFAGIARGVATQPNLRIHLAAAIAVLLLAGIVSLRAPYALALIGAVGLVVVAELLNTALEAAVDLVTRDIHPLARDAKDLGAAAVLVATIVATGVGALALAAGLQEGAEPVPRTAAVARTVEFGGAALALVALAIGRRRPA